MEMTEEAFVAKVNLLLTFLPDGTEAIEEACALYMEEGDTREFNRRCKAAILLPRMPQVLSRISDSEKNEIRKSMLEIACSPQQAGAVSRIDDEAVIGGLCQSMLLLVAQRIVAEFKATRS